ncbi:precorrin-8X/cobalt-precorrin-8 methylmutase [uncultured bacterium]|nr:precorrin-8X/cobalt-precorrin-8 methylmutase [uncultured bacterium]
MAGNNSRAIMLLGHGSKAPEANETLRRAAAAVEERGGYGMVLPAFLQMERPDFQEAVDELVSKGFTDVTVMPYFLYMGLHVTKDLPAEMEEAKKRHAGLKVALTQNLGFHDKLIDITIQRIEEFASSGEKAAQKPCQHPIEKESFRIIGTELDESAFPAIELPVIKRVIHTTADFEFKDILRFTPGAVEAGVKAIREGRPVITDVRMVEAGIMKYRLDPFGAKTFCFSSDRSVADAAIAKGTTKTAASMKKAAEYMEGGIVAVGNAPTALFELLRIISAGGPKPALIVGVPVGFVGAAESKEALEKSGLTSIFTRGRKGGSTVAVAIVNALAILAGQAEAGKP